MALDWDQISARRLARAGLAVPFEGTPSDVVAAMCGAHAQVASAAELSVALRLGGAVTRADVREDGDVVKTFGPRGTVHLLPGRDLPWWTTALSAVPGAPHPMPESARMTEQQTEEVVAGIGEALLDADGGLTVDELNEQVVTRTGAWAGDLVMPAFQEMWPRWRQAIALAARRGLLCLGRSPRGRKVTYTHPRRLLPGFRPARSEKDALAQLVRRYLYAYGPATPQDFAQWLGAPKRWAAELFASAGQGGGIEETAFEWGGTAWQLAGDDLPEDEAPRGVRLLPYFDSYVIACRPRDRLFPGRAFERALAGGQAGNFPVLLVDGVVGGVWHQRRSGRRIDVTVEAFATPTRSQRAELEAQAERVAQILEGIPRLALGRVTVGPHA
jgi:winged helix DNA-binding protein